MKKILIILSALVFIGCDKAPAKPDYFSKKLAEVELAYKQHPEDINKTDENDTTPLIRAIARDRIEIAKFLINKGADVTYVPSNEEWGTALGYAVGTPRDNYEIIDLLIQNGADINIKDYVGDTPLLHGLLRYKDVNIKNIEYILEHGADANISNENGITPLLEIATVTDKDTSDFIRLLIKHGALLNEKYPENATILMYCAEFNAHINNVQTLIENGENVNLHFDDGWTSLMEAVKNNNIKLMRLLLDNKADVNAATEIGATALMFAAQRDIDSSEIIELLLKYGANINHRANDGGTALSVAVNFGHINNVKTLLEHNADTELYEYGSWPILSVSIGKNNKEMVNILLEHGCNPNTKIENGGPTALMLAAIHNNYELVRMLIEKGANVNEISFEGATALFSAVSLGNIDVVKYLVDHGADVNFINNEGWSPLIIAADNGYLDIVKYLVEHGANIEHNILKDDTIKLMRLTALTKAIQHNHLDVAKYLVSKGASHDGMVMAAELSFNIDIMRYVANTSTERSVKNLKLKLQTCDMFLINLAKLTVMNAPADKQENIAESNFGAATYLYTFLSMVPQNKRTSESYGSKNTDSDYLNAYKYVLSELSYRNLLYAKQTDETLNDISKYFVKKTNGNESFYRGLFLIPGTFVCTMLHDSINE